MIEDKTVEPLRILNLRAFADLARARHPRWAQALDRIAGQGEGWVAWCEWRHELAGSGPWADFVFCVERPEQAAALAEVGVPRGIVFTWREARQFLEVLDLPVATLEVAAAVFTLPEIAGPLRAFPEASDAVAPEEGRHADA